MDKVYKNVTIKFEERMSKKTGNKYIAVIGIFKNAINEDVEVFLGFENLAKDIRFKV